MRTEQRIYKDIADTVTVYVPSGWKKIIIVAKIESDNGETTYDYIDESGAQRWFVPDTHNQYQVYLAFQELRSLMSTTNNLWNTACFSIDRSDAFHIKFDYEI